MKEIWTRYQTVLSLIYENKKYQIEIKRYEALIEDETEKDRELNEVELWFIRQKLFLNELILKDVTRQIEVFISLYNENLSLVGGSVESSEEDSWILVMKSRLARNMPVDNIPLPLSVKSKIVNGDQ